jgi:hypothetical protein
MRRVITALALMSLTACAGGLNPFGPPGDPEAEAASDAGPVAVPMERPPVEDAAAAVGPSDPGADGRFLGFSVTSLGDAADPGLWLETPLVAEEGPGRVVAENGQTIAVTLRPSGGDDGSGSRLSLAGFQALGLELTALPTLTVISDA